MQRFIVFLDSSGIWCAAPPGFRDLVLDPVGWGATPREAIRALAGQPEFQERARDERWPRPTLQNCVEVPEPPGARIVRISFNADMPGWRAALRRRNFRVISNPAAPPATGD